METFGLGLLGKNVMDKKIILLPEAPTSTVGDFNDNLSTLWHLEASASKVLEICHFVDFLSLHLASAYWRKSKCNIKLICTCRGASAD